MSIGARYADYRTKGYGSRGRKKEEIIPDPHYDWARDIIRIRGEELAGTHSKELVQIFDGNDRTIDLIAHKYLGDDYRISPRTARRAVYHALEVLVAKKILNSDELAFIDPDPLHVKRPLYEKLKKYGRVKKELVEV